MLTPKMVMQRKVHMQKHSLRAMHKPDKHAIISWQQRRVLHQIDIDDLCLYLANGIDHAKCCWVPELRAWVPKREIWKVYYDTTRPAWPENVRP